MDKAEHEQFLASVAKAAKLIRQAQTDLQRARDACHGELYEHLNLIFTRGYELQVRLEWVRHVALGNVELKVPEFDPENREAPDRRRSVDRRVAGMRKQLLRFEGG